MHEKPYIYIGEDIVNHWMFKDSQKVKIFTFIALSVNDLREFNTTFYKLARQCDKTITRIKIINFLEKLSDEGLMSIQFSRNDISIYLHDSNLFKLS